MAKFVAFLRGINVGGHRKIPMSDLRQLCVGITSDPDLRTYIASGNLVFDADGAAARWATSIAEGIRARFGFDVPVLVLTEAAMRAALAACPFPRDAGKLVHGYFCFEKPQLDRAGVDALITPTEAVSVQGQTVWLHAPDGIGRSKLAARMERLIGVEVTARNLNTIIKMVEMLGGDAGKPG